jgi:hypothetical protein
MKPSLSQRWRALRPRGEDGSIVMALLAAIVTAGLVTVIVAATITGQRSVRFDQEFTSAVHVAEAGIEEVVYKLNTRLIGGSDDHDDDDPVIVTGTGTIDDNSYEWTATQISNHEWRVVSSRTDDTVNRTIEAIVGDQPVFNLAAFSDLLLSFAGTNLADSYDSRFPSDPSAWCTGKGRVGSNDELEFKGSGAGQAVCTYDRDKQTVDGVDLYDWDDDDPQPGRCNHNGGTNCYEGNDPNKEWYLDTHANRVEFDGHVDWMEEVLALCGNDLQPVEADGHFGGVIPPASAASTNPKAVQDPNPETNRYVYCAESLEFDVHTKLHADASPDNPVVFVVAEWVNADRKQGNRLRVNCDACTANSFNPTNPRVYPEAGALQIYTPAGDEVGDPGDPVVRVSQQSRFAAAVVAPNGTCGGGAGVHMFGSLMCRELVNVGGWLFHYDEALADAIRTGEYRVTRWAEL